MSCLPRVVDAMTTAYLGLGSNQGDRAQHLQAAVEGLHAADGLRVSAVSPVYETEAHVRGPDEEQPAFLNAVVAIETKCTPEEVLLTAQAIEQKEGRVRKESAPRWQPRPLDIDLLVVGEETRATDTLSLPHPRLAERRFVLRPWADLAPNLRVPPPFDTTVRALLLRCSDTADVRPASSTLVVPTPEPPEATHD